MKAERQTSRSVTLKDLSVVDPDVDAVSTGLAKYGAVVLPQWLDAEHTGLLRSDFDAAFAAVDIKPDELTNEGKDLSHVFGRTVTGEHIKYGNSQLRGQLEATHRVFNDPFMRDVANRYLGTPNTVNRHVILTDDYRANDEVIAYHFDEIRSLKFLVYLDDVDAANGPFEVIPGTQDAGAQFRISEWTRTRDFNKITIRVFDLPDDFFYTMFGHFKPFLAARSVSVHAPAGTLIIFTTDVIHRAGVLAEERRRRVIRGSSYGGIWP